MGERKRERRERGGSEEEDDLSSLCDTLICEGMIATDEKLSARTIALLWLAQADSNEGREEGKANGLSLLLTDDPEKRRKREAFIAFPKREHHRGQKSVERID